MVQIKKKESTKYSKISIPDEMKKEIERIIENDTRLGFVSVQEFVKEAVRRNIIHYSGVYDEKEKDL